ncbi:MAG: hypothetical protein UT84_C0003G0072 [Candidatus Curtissbacteria bacterium GW2011_GWA1_40_16]|uniref:Integral membrane protein n=1 Tax=Candidatus Curtissbacteria bacterium GW2011_GWA1_40_16 TaxID=1618405 RepID=A0A0G0ULF1_9BACT|nr:MAG: hypothetical protein UT84_C0003G0072 [Candidatus Curtissbacteria bacterium GW2011_GWA1_40_16]
MKQNIDGYLKEVLARKEKYLSENEQYRKHENLYHRHTAGKYIGDFIYGANDGIITTFAVVAGAVGASLSPVVILILGFANIVADGFSMGASNYLGRRSEQDYARAQRKKEEWEIDHLREIEVEEIREIFEKKGFRGKDLERAVEIVTSNRNVWLDVMMKDELGIIESGKEDPRKHGLVTFCAFIVAGIIPLLPFVVPGLPNTFLISVVLGGIALFAAGAFRTLITTVSWVRGGLEVLLVGSSAAVAAYIVGYFVEGLVR